MTFLWDLADSPDEESHEESSPAARVRPRTAVWSRRGGAFLALGCSGWVLLALAFWITGAPRVIGTYLGLAVWWAGFVVAALISTIAIVAACLKRSWGIALLSLALAAAGVFVTTRYNSQGDYVEYEYHVHRTALIKLAQDYRAGRLRDGEVPLTPELRSLCPSGFAYTNDTALFVQMWEDWRSESGTGLGYFAEPPTAETDIPTAEGDRGRPQRELGDGWWWVE